MDCTKKSVDSMEFANFRAMEINGKNHRINGQKKLLRPYKCEFCGNIHLTSISKRNYRLKYDIPFKNKIHEEKFIKEESERWDEYFGNN